MDNRSIGQLLGQLIKQNQVVDERSDLMKDTENTFYGGGHVQPTATPTPVPTPKPTHNWLARMLGMS